MQLLHKMSSEDHNERVGDRVGSEAPAGNDAPASGSSSYGASGMNSALGGGVDPLASAGKGPEMDKYISLKIDNLSYDASKDDLLGAFSTHGTVVDVFIPRDRETRRSRGFAFVRYANRDEAERALAAENGKELQGRPMRIEIAKYGRNDRPEGEGGGYRGGGRGRGRGGFRGGRGGYGGGGYDQGGYGGGGGEF
jgi:RNA recognition motif. (a.k.a. RRM, RBD, or RNP domain)